MVKGKKKIKILLIARKRDKKNYLGVSFEEEERKEIAKQKNVVGEIIGLHPLAVIISLTLRGIFNPQELLHSTKWPTKQN